MLIVDINTNKIVYHYKDGYKHIIYSTKEYWDNYVKEVTLWSRELERKLLYE